MASGPLVVITGGAGDLGKALGSAFAAQGYHTRTPGRDELDVTSAASVTAYFSSLDRVDVLVNNAGIVNDALLARQSPADWDAVVKTNLKGAFLCSQAAAKLMLRQRNGHIISIGSYSALKPPLGQTSYVASKAGLIALTKSLAKEFGSRNLCCNCVLPGFLETQMTRFLDEAVRSKALAAHQLGRFTTTDEAAEFVCFLAGRTHISGQVFQLDSRT